MILEAVLLQLWSYAIFACVSQRTTYMDTVIVSTPRATLSHLLLDHDVHRALPQMHVRVLGELPIAPDRVLGAYRLARRPP